MLLGANTTLRPAALPGWAAAGRRAAPSSARSQRRLQICRAEGEEPAQGGPPAEPTPTATQAPPPPGPGEDSLQLPKEVITQLRNTVFSFDTFFVTSVENYQADGVLFKGNLRGDPAAAYRKLSARLKEQLGEQYKMYLLENQEEQPVVVVLPVSAVQPQVAPSTEAALAALFGAASVLTTLNIFSSQEIFNAALLTVGWNSEAVAAALPGSLAFLGILGVHELGHLWAARQRGLELAPPLLLPAGLGLLGSFGGITRIKSFVPDRASLAAVASAGPLASSAVALGVMLVGAGLTAAGQGGVELDVDSFRESLLAGALGQAAFGGQLFDSDAVSTNPLFVAGWAGLIINAINMLPAGELDGGRTFLGLCGRRAASRMGAVTLLLLGLAGFTSSLALFWLLLVLFLQRGPITPCNDELTPVPDGPIRIAAIAALLLPLLVLLPYPMALSITDGLPDLPPTF